MIANSPHTFKVTQGFNHYQVIDEDLDSPNVFHRHTVIHWTKTPFQKGYVLQACDSNIYAQSKIKAIKVFNEKYKQEKKNQ